MRPLWRLTSTLFGLTLLCSPSAAQEEAKWLHPEANPSVLNTAPAECLAWPENASEADLARVGRVVFRSPFLLGGLAGRSGLSCNACHRNGHGNPHFFIAGVSGVPGTADVTGAIFSKTRDDGHFNPVPIPSLVDSSAPFGTAQPAETLQAFLEQAIQHEFDGKLPPDPILEALIAYLSGLRSEACPAEAVVEMSLRLRTVATEEALFAVRWSVAMGYYETADLLLISLKQTLQPLHTLSPNTEQKAAILALSADLDDIRPLLKRDGSEAQRTLGQWQEAFAQLFPT